MFDRLIWYRTLGFQELWFQEELKKQGLPNCASAFLGTCDADVAAWIGRRLEEDTSRPKLIHWMTLNSHLPVPVPSYLRNAAPVSYTHLDVYKRQPPGWLPCIWIRGAGIAQ